MFNQFENHNCKNKNLECHSITVEKRKRIFENFWSAGSFNVQNAFIAGSVKQTPAGVHVVVNNTDGHEQFADNTKNRRSGKQMKSEKNKEVKTSSKKQKKLY